MWWPLAVRRQPARHAHRRALGIAQLLFSLPDKRLRGVHVIGDNACELVAAGLVGMTLGATCSTFVDTCFNFPSLSDLYKEAAYDSIDRVNRRDVYRP